MIYNIDVTKEGDLLTGKDRGYLFADENVIKSYLPTSIKILYTGSQMITSSFFYGVLKWLEETFEFEGLGAYSFKRIISLVNVDDLITEEFNRALDRL